MMVKKLVSDVCEQICFLGPSGALEDVEFLVLGDVYRIRSGIFVISE